MSRRSPLDVAIVGMACRFPGAGDLFAYWEDILADVDARDGVGPSTMAGEAGEAEPSLVLETARAAMLDAGAASPGRTIEMVVGRGMDPDRASALSGLILGAKALTARIADLALVGEVSGEGVGMVALKRRLDAERDGDRIYAVLKGVGIARGPARAIRRAYRASGIDPATVGLVEGHGPGAGAAESRALRAVFPPIPCGRRVLGGGSSGTGRAGPAAGIAGLIKAALALHHRVLPPALHADAPRPPLDGRFTPNPTARPWVQGDPTIPRRAGVNAFGFAGIDAHAVLEEHPASNDADDSPGALLHWDSEAILLSSIDRDGLIGEVRSLLGWLGVGPDVALKDLAFTLNTAGAEGPCRLGLVARSLEDLASRLQAALARLLDPACRSIRDARGAYFWERGEGPAPKLAFLFPGEGSQYPGMLADLCPHFPEVRALFDTSDRISRESGAATRPSEHLFAPSNGQGAELWSAEVAVNVVLSAQWGLFKLLSKLGLRADAIIGHSSGELLALAAAGVLEVDRTFEDKLGELGAIFGRLETSGELPTARLVAVAASREKVEAAIGAGGRVEVAMDNCPHQVVIAGDPGSVEAAVGRLQAGGMVCEDLPFSRAYHTPGFAPALGPIAGFFDSLAMSPPRVPVYSCASEGRMPDDPALIRRLAVDQWTRPVGFRRAVEAMHADGVDVFVDVGARGNLAGFVEDTLRGRPALAVAANLPRRSGTNQLNHLVASLFARGVDLKPDHLYARRRPVRIDLGAVPEKAACLPAPSVGFPAMTLSAGPVDRLRAKATKPDRSVSPPAPGGGPGLRGVGSPLDPGRVSRRLGLALPGDGSRQSEPCPTGLLHHREHHSTCLDPHPGPLPGGEGGMKAAFAAEEDWPTLAAPSAIEGAGATLLDFQETMAAFLQTQRAVMDAFLTAVPVPEEEWAFGLSNGHVEPVAGPWAGVLVSLVEGREAVSMLTLDADGDPVAEHHTLGGRRVSSLHLEWRGLPVLPFAVMAEMLAEAAARLIPGTPLLGLLDVRAHRWIRYEDEPIALEIHASVVADSGSSVRVAIHNRGPLRAMRPVEPPVFEGVVAFGESRPVAPIAPAFSLASPEACRFTPGSIYGEQWLFHGPALRAVVGIGPIAMGGIEGTLRVLPLEPLLREGEDPAGLLTDPIILDNFTHLLGGWGLDRLADDGDVIFPLRMGELAIFGEGPAVGSDVSCRIAIREVERHRVLADADIVRGDGSTWMTIRGWEDWRFHWPARYRDGFRQPDRTFLGEPLDLPGLDPRRAKAVWLEPPGDMGRPVWRDVLEHVQLGPDERAAYLALPGPDLRRTHRLWGRIAAKEAARRLRLERGHPPEYPADLIIDRDPLGRPSLRSRLEPDADRLPAVSIAHVDGVAVALACVDPAGRPGIDVEPIVRRSTTFEATAFLPGERSLLGDRPGDDRAEWVARLWCAKEAVAKATGLGFVDGPSGSEVVAVNPDGSLGVRLRGGLAEGCPDLAGRLIRVVSARRGDFVWAWTLGEGKES